MNILVTGATGFIGRYLVGELAKSNHNIFCLVRKTSKTKPLESLGVKFIDADITQPEILNLNIEDKIEVVFHCAGYVGDKDKEMLYKVNVLGTENICELAMRLGVKRLVYLSTVAVVSGNPQIPLVEELPYWATNRYGESKIEAEKVVLRYREKGLKAVIFRPCMVYGEDEPHMMKLLLSLLKYRLFPLVNQGKNKFHLVYVKNVVAAMIFSLSKDEFLKGTFFIADKEVLTTKEVMTIMAKSIGAKPPYQIPAIITPLLLHLPCLGKKLKFFTKDRVYSTKRLTSLGFTYRYSTWASLKASCQAIRESS